MCVVKLWQLVTKICSLFNVGLFKWFGTRVLGFERIEQSTCVISWHNHFEIFSYASFVIKDKRSVCSNNNKKRETKSNRRLSPITNKPLMRTCALTSHLTSNMLMIFSFFSIFFETIFPVEWITAPSMKESIVLNKFFYYRAMHLTRREGYQEIKKPLKENEAGWILSCLFSV